mmetsp:Transcript_33129/g.80461  ORF Transcript_33129/g.80461 Transcript_33129/m.80461 type:complete len:88 (+) Transcript_33129:2682-2945(+)
MRAARRRHSVLQLSVVMTTIHAGGLHSWTAPAATGQDAMERYLRAKVSVIWWSRTRHAPSGAIQFAPTPPLMFDCCPPNISNQTITL